MKSYDFFPAVPEKEIVESIGTVSQPSKPGGTREGQTIKIQVPTLNVPTSQSDSQGQRKPLVKKTKPVDSQVYLIIEMSSVKEGYLDILH